MEFPDSSPQHGTQPNRQTPHFDVDDLLVCFFNFFLVPGFCLLIDLGFVLIA